MHPYGASSPANRTRKRARRKRLPIVTIEQPLAVISAALLVFSLFFASVHVPIIRQVVADDKRNPFFCPSQTSRTICFEKQCLLPRKVESARNETLPSLDLALGSFRVIKEKPPRQRSRDTRATLYLIRVFLHLESKFNSMINIYIYIYIFFFFFFLYRAETFLHSSKGLCINGSEQFAYTALYSCADALIRERYSQPIDITLLKMYFVCDGVYSQSSRRPRFSKVKTESRESRVACITCRLRRADLSD